MSKTSIWGGPRNGEQPTGQVDALFETASTGHRMNHLGGGKSQTTIPREEAVAIARRLVEIAARFRIAAPSDDEG